MNIALLISGEARTFVLKEQRLFFQRLINYLKQFYKIVDVFIVLKIPDEHNKAFIKSKNGVKNFKKIINILNPKYLFCFYDFIHSTTFTAYNIQLKLLDMCIDSAIEYQNKNNIVYDMFFRVRPDSCFLLQDIDILNKTKNYIYTSIKSDAPANDQVIIVNRHILYSWWFKCVKLLINNPILYPPEYTIYKNYKPFLISNFQNWLIRDYNEVCSWDKNATNKLPLSSEYTFKYSKNYEKLLIDISHTKFIEKLKNIQNMTLDTYIQYT